MIIQTAPEQSAHLVVPMSDHTSLADQFAAAFGNENFAGLNPEGLMRFLVANHDAGWNEVDARMPMDPNTGLPCNLLQTPMDDLVQTGAPSAAFNEEHHPYCGLLISMHVYGLYHGRYGLSDKIVVDLLPKEVRPKFDTMLNAELARQERLKSSLSADPAMVEYVDETMLFHNYKLLQFFDTLSLYFCMEHPDRREQSTFLNVPKSVGNDVSVTVTPLDDGTYQVSPFPFKGASLEVELPGHAMMPQAPGEDIQAVLTATPKTSEKVTLVA